MKFFFHTIHGGSWEKIFLIELYLYTSALALFISATSRYVLNPLFRYNYPYAGSHSFIRTACLVVFNNLITNYMHSFIFDYRHNSTLHTTLVAVGTFSSHLFLRLFRGQSVPFSNFYYTILLEVDTYYWLLYKFGNYAWLTY